MKSIFLLIITLLASLAGHSQGKIRVEVSASGDTTWSTKEQKIYVKPGSRNAVAEMLKSSVYKMGDNYLISMYIQTGRTSIFTIGSGSPMVLTLADGNSVTVLTRSSSQSRTLVSDYGCFAYAFYLVPPQAIKLLLASPVTRMVITASVGAMEYEIKEKQSDIIMEQVRRIQHRNGEPD